jgi:archaellum biogenesis protein FlaJ (TadC family)
MALFLHPVGSATVRQSFDAQRVIHAQQVAAQFIFGIVTFVIAYLLWFMTVVEIDAFLSAGEDKNSPNNLLWKPTKTADQHRRRSRMFFIISVSLAMVSFIFLIFALGDVVKMAIHVAFGL